jgi:hypothetical protein
MPDSHGPQVIRINYEKLAARLGISVIDATLWLVRNGFKPEAGYWHADGEVSLLRPDEIIERRERHTEADITFIDPIPPADSSDQGDQGD